MKRTLLWVLSVVVLTTLCVGAFFIFGAVTDRLHREADLASHPQEYFASVSAASAQYGVPQSVIYAVMRTESNFDPEAVSHAGAVGLMQIMPQTYEWICFLRGVEADVTVLSDPAVNIDAGVYLLSWLYDRYEDWKLVYAAYNAGYSRVNGWLSDPAYAEDGKLTHIPIYETEQYVKRVSETRYMYITLYQMEESEETKTP